MGVITYNGVASSAYGIVVEHPPGYSYPKRDYEIVHVPGRNGDILFDNGSYQNVARSYEIAIGSLSREFAAMANDISKWLHSASGYARLEDTYEPDYYRMAYYEEEQDITNILFHAGRATIQFVCKPQRYLKTGETAITVNGTTTIINPSDQVSLPIVKVYGSGSGAFTLNGATVSLSSIQNGMIIDSELKDSYLGATNYNNRVTLSNDYPNLNPGSNSVSISGGVTRLEVTPRWWTL